MSSNKDRSDSLALENTLIEWLRGDNARMEALRIAATLELTDWCLAAGFVRNLVWDRLDGRRQATPLNDIDCVYFDAANVTAAIDVALERRLRSQSNLPWSVKNQARMHVRNGHAPYASTRDAMSYWIEIETAVGVTLTTNGEIQVLAPFGLEPLFAGTITLNPRSGNRDEFSRRVEAKAWRSTWPKLRIADYNRA